MLNEPSCLPAARIVDSLLWESGMVNLVVICIGRWKIMTEPSDTESLQRFVATSTRVKQMVEEFHRITTEYDKMAQQLAASGIPQRRAELIMSIINSSTPRRTYAEVGALLGGMSSARVGQILKAAYRRMLRAEVQDAA